MMPLFKVTFHNPKRVFYLRAEDGERAAELAGLVEEILEHTRRGRTVDDALVEALIRAED